MAKGVVYALVGGLALETALGFGHDTADVTEALQLLLQQPGGLLYLALMVVGFFGYALWRGVQVLFNPEPRGKGWKEAVYRIAYAVSGITYAVLGGTALRLLIGLGHRPASGAGWLEPVLQRPLGQWGLGSVGVVLLGMGGYYAHRSYTARFHEELQLHRMNDGEVRWMTLIGQIGHAARAVVFGLAGIFLIRAAFHSNPKEIQGLGGILNSLGQQRYGAVLLGVVATGLLLYGVYMCVAARYRRLWA